MDFLAALKIIELREKAKRILSEKFEIKNFHGHLLEDGALPLNLAEDKINRWIEASR